ncbi:4-phosphoerythronate dehydrogenase [Hyaloraphidium curvatum]|nr:4-phosphoerythronate dehydrogenase [Hyaloraphidium curvatum]
MAARRVVRFGLPGLDRAFADILSSAGVHLDTIPLDTPEDVAFETLSKADVYQISSAKDELGARFAAGPGLLVRCPSLQMVSTNGAGFDTVDVAACTAAGVLVANQSGANAAAVAEHTIGFLLTLVKRIGESDRRLRAPQRGFVREDLMGREVGGRTIGLVGIGHVGTKVAALSRALGMRVLATDPLLAPEEIVRRGADPVGFEDLLARSDVVSLHCPRDASTAGLFSASAFSRMKPGSLFLTTARGGIHSEAALYDALASGHLAGAGVDVWDKEPPPADHPLLSLPNVVATFHTAGVTFEARKAMAEWAAEQIVGLFKGEVPPRLVNPEALPAWKERFGGRAV